MCLLIVFMFIWFRLPPWRWLCFGARQEALGNWEARVFLGIKGAGNTELLGGKEGSKPNNK